MGALAGSSQPKYMAVEQTIKEKANISDKHCLAFFFIAHDTHPVPLT